MRRLSPALLCAALYFCVFPSTKSVFAQAYLGAGGPRVASGSAAARSSAAEVPAASRPSQPTTPVTTETVGGKVTYYLRSTVSFRNFLEAGFLTGIPNLPSAPAQPQPAAVLDYTSGKAYENQMNAYGDAMDNWRRDSEDELRYRGRRFAVGLATAETRDLFSNMLFPIALRQQGRYVPANLDSSFDQRMGHAFASIVVTPGDNGHLQPNWSKWLGTVGAAYVGREIYASELNVPQLERSQFVERYIGYSLAGDLATNVGRELVRTAIRPDLQTYESRGPATQDSYYPLSIGGKFFYWAHSTYAMRNFVQGALIAGIPTVDSQPEYPATPVITTEQQELAFDAVLAQYGQQVQGWRDSLEDNVRYHERRLIGGFGESETQEFLSNFLVPATTRMDPRYIPLGAGHSFGSRVGNAFSGLVVGHMDSGRRMVNLPVLVGTVGAAFIAREAYYPKLGVDSLESNRVLGKTIGFNLAADSIFNLFNEFHTRRSF